MWRATWWWGTAKVYKASYRDVNVRLHDIDGSATLHVTPTELLLTALTGYLPGGGKRNGSFADCELAGRGSATGHCSDFGYDEGRGDDDE
ncbi:MAG: hypothetical protein WDN23_21415 [Edaphobacter sp.]